MLLDGVESPFFFIGRRGKPLSSDGIRKIFKRAVREAGLDPSLSPHAMRHSFATDLLNGEPICEASRRCSDMRVFPLRRSTRMSRPMSSSASTGALIRAVDVRRRPCIERGVAQSGGFGRVGGPHHPWLSSWYSAVCCSGKCRTARLC